MGNLEPSGHSVVVSLLVAAGGFGSTGCVAELWPDDGYGEPAGGACLSTRRAPALDAGGDNRITIDATDRETLRIDLDAAGEGVDFVGAISLTHGVGTVELGCERVQAAVYRRFAGLGCSN